MGERHEAVICQDPSDLGETAPHMDLGVRGAGVSAVLPVGAAVTQAVAPCCMSHLIAALAIPLCGLP